MIERDPTVKQKGPETERGPEPLLWAQQDYLSELVAALRRNPDLSDIGALVACSALPPDHAAKMKRQTSAALGAEVTTLQVVRFESQLHESGAPLGVDPKDVDYDTSWRTCHQLSVDLERRKNEATKGRNLSQLDTYGYMKHTLGEHRLLGRDEEHALSAVIWSARSQLSLAAPELGLILRSGNYDKKSANQIMRELGGEPHLRRLYQQYREALDTFTLYNQRLALGYLTDRNVAGLPSEELMVGAQMGLRRAVELYDASTGNKFSTFATPWLRQCVDREVARADLIRTPARVRELRGTLLGVVAELMARTGRHPSLEEITTHIDQLKENLEETKNLKNDRAPKRYDGLTRETISDLLSVPQVTASLDKAVDDDGDPHTLYDSRQTGVVDRVEGIELRDALVRMARAARLTEQEQGVFEVLIEYSSIHDDAGLTKLLVQKMNITPNRVRRLVRRVREKLHEQSGEFKNIAFE